MKNISTEQLLEDIKNGKPVDTAMIPGHVHTPVMPKEVFAVKDGRAALFIAYLRKVAVSTAHPKADITERVIENTHFHKSCQSAYGDLCSEYDEIRGLGCTWIHEGRLCAVPMTAREVKKAKEALESILENVLVPVDGHEITRIGDDNRAAINEKNKDLLDFVNGGR